MSNIRADEISDAAGTGPVTLTKQSAAKAWVSASGAAVIFESVNVSSGTDGGTGAYSYALTNAFTTVSYPVQGTANTGSTTTRIVMKDGNANTASAMVVFSKDQSGGAFDTGNCVTAHGDLA